MDIDYRDLKEKLWEMLPKGENKDEAVAKLAEGLSEEAKKRYSKAMEIYNDYKKFKRDLQGAMLFGPYSDKNRSNCIKLSLRNPSVTNTLLGLLNESYKLASSEINSTKTFLSRWGNNTVYVTRAAAAKVSSIVLGGGEDKIITEFDRLVNAPIKNLCRVANSFNDPDKNMDEEKAEELRCSVQQNIVEELKKTQASLLKYVNYTMEKLSDESVLKDMPGTQVFLRILLGLSGITRKGSKTIEDISDISQMYKIYLKNIKNNSQLYKKHLNSIGINGGGLLALLTVYTLNAYECLYGLHPQNIVPDKELYNEIESKKWGKLDSVRAKYEKH